MLGPGGDPNARALATRPGALRFSAPRWTHFRPSPSACKHEPEAHHRRLGVTAAVDGHAGAALGGAQEAALVPSGVCRVPVHGAIGRSVFDDDPPSASRRRRSPCRGQGACSVCRASCCEGLRDGIAATAPRKNGTAGAGGGGEPPYRRPVSRGVPDVQSGPDRPSARYVSLSSRSCRPSSRALSSSGVSRSSGGCSCLRRRSHAETRANMPLMLLPAAVKGRGPGGGRTPSASSNPALDPKRPQAASPDVLSAMSSTIRTVGWSASST
jgi:hypothetical protein